MICKLFDLMESPVFGIQTKQNWKSIYGLAWATSVILDNVEKIVDQIQRNHHVAKLSDVLQEMPQTEMLLGSFLRNLSPIILDIVDMITLRPVALVSECSRIVIISSAEPSFILRRSNELHDENETFSPYPQISVLDDYKEREKFWPCILNESVSATLELRNGSREVVRQIERIGCDPSSFIKEWKEQPMLMRVRKIVSSPRSRARARAREIIYRK